LAFCIIEKGFVVNKKEIVAAQPQAVLIHAIGGESWNSINEGLLNVMDGLCVAHFLESQSGSVFAILRGISKLRIVEVPHLANFHRHVLTLARGWQHTLQAKETRVWIYILSKPWKHVSGCG
jgi:hypothetical protein